MECAQGSLPGVLLSWSWRSVSCWEGEALGALGGQRSLALPREQGGLSGGGGTQSRWTEVSQKRYGKGAPSLTHVFPIFVPSPNLGDTRVIAVTNGSNPRARYWGTGMGRRSCGRQEKASWESRGFLS